MSQPNVPPRILNRQYTTNPGGHAAVRDDAEVDPNKKVDPDDWKKPSPEARVLASLISSDGAGPYRYAFSFSSELDENTRGLHQLAGGVRKQVNYLSRPDGGTQWSDGAERPSVMSLQGPTAAQRVTWNGAPIEVIGGIANGSDWVFVDSLGVGTFNARVTLKLACDPKAGLSLANRRDYLLVDATVKGTVDLAVTKVQKLYAAQKNPNVVDDFLQKDGKGVFDLDKYVVGEVDAGKTKVPVSMSVRFEGPTGPLALEGADDDALKDEKRRQAAFITHYGALSRGQFFAAGYVQVDRSKPGWPAEHIEAHVFAIHFPEATVSR